MKTVDDFIFSVERKFVTNGKVKVQGSVELINYQPAESDVIIELESRRIWLTNVYTCVFFNDYVKEKIREGFMKRIIINGITGSSWHFKRFERLSVISTRNINVLVYEKKWTILILNK